MYPYVIVGDLKIYMVSIGIFISLAVFIFLLYKFTKYYKLSFWKFIYIFPIILLLMYIFGSYIYIVLNFKIIFPLHMSDLLSLIFPSDYRFHFVWISFGFLLWFLYFLSTLNTNLERFKRIDVIFYSLMISLFVLWIFLTLWDNFIWKPTDSKIWISSLVLCEDINKDCFKPISKLDDFVAVHPVWLYFSLVSILAFFIIFILNFFIKRFWLGILGFILFLIFINIVFIFQQYPRYLPVRVGDFVFDIKTWWSIILIFFIVFWYIGVKFKTRN